MNNGTKNKGIKSEGGRRRAAAYFYFLFIN